jgi:GNAT superfamily N-acetyltransferase
MPTPDIRRGTADDVRPAYEVFRQSLWDLMQRTGLIAPESPLDTEESWTRHRSLSEHIFKHAAEFWVAEDTDGVAAMARSIERDGVFQLTEFFVHPRVQSRGVGRELLDRAFPLGRGRHRSILATQDSRALALYLRSGVRFQSTMVDFEVIPTPHEYETDLEFVSLAELDDPVSSIGALDRRLLDHDRPVDIGFMLSDRPGYLYRRDGKAVGYGFESNGDFAGPILVSDSSDLPAALSHLENAAAETEVARIDVELALDAETGVEWMLQRGHRMFPFYIVMLASDPFIPRDRYVPFGPPWFF